MKLADQPFDPINELCVHIRVVLVEVSKPCKAATFNIVKVMSSKVVIRDIAPRMVVD